jgi:hypothetical protein
LLEGTRFCYPAESRAVESWRTIPNREDALLNPRFAAGRFAAAANSLILSRRSDFYKHFVCVLTTFEGAMVELECDSIIGVKPRLQISGL